MEFILLIIAIVIFGFGFCGICCGISEWDGEIFGFGICLLVFGLFLFLATCGLGTESIKEPRTSTEISTVEQPDNDNAAELRSVIARQNKTIATQSDTIKNTTDKLENLRELATRQSQKIETQNEIIELLWKDSINENILLQQQMKLGETKQ